MNLLKIAITVSDLGQPLRQALVTAAKLGARGVVIDARQELRPQDLSRTGVRQFRKMLEELHLHVAALSFQTRRGYDSTDELDRRVDATKEVMTFARSLGAGFVLNQVGRVPAEDSPAWPLLCEVLSDLGRHGDRTGALLAAKTGSESGAELARLFAALPDGSLAVDLDPGALLINGHSPREAVTALGRNILHVTARDGVRDLAAGRGIEVQLGRGSADFPELFGLLEEHGFRGWSAIRRSGSSDPVHEIGESVEYLQALGE